MHAARPNLASTTALSSLALRPKLFLWAVRHLILSVRCNRPVCAHVQQTFDLAKIPMLPFLIEELLHTIAQHATRQIEFSHPSSTRLLADERRFVECLQALMAEPSGCGYHHLSDMLPSRHIDKVMPRFALVAATLKQCSRPLHAFPASLAAQSPSTFESATPLIH